MTTTTTIFVNISAQDAIKQSCQCGWQRIEANLSDYTPSEREMLASVVKSDNGIKLDHSVAPPTSDALHRHVSDLVAAKLEQAVRDIQEVRAAVESAKALPFDKLSSAIQSTCASHDQTARRKAALDALGLTYGMSYSGPFLTPASVGREAEFEAYEADRLAKEEAARAKRETKEAAVRAERKAKEEAIRAEYDALYARLPEELRERDEAGFAGSEVKSAIKALIRADAELPPCEGWEKKDMIDSLSADEFVAFKRAEQAAPEGATVEAETVYNGGGYRKATADDDPDDIDDDGEVAIPRENERRRAVIRWSRGGIEVVSQLPLE